MSNYTKTTNFLAKDSLPDTDTAKIIRGSEFDTEFNNLVTAVASKANTLSPTLTGIPTAPTAAAGTSSLQLATTAFATIAAAAAFPAGGIIMWSGAVSAIPLGWLLCDGTSSTPNLKNRFVIGAGDTYAVDATGGSADAVAVNHTHTASVVDPGHVHTYQMANNGGGGGSGEIDVRNATPGVNTGSATTGITVTVNPLTGEDGTNKNLPPYYALAYIMKS